jgi:hypothetical protein
MDECAGPPAAAVDRPMMQLGKSMKSHLAMIATLLLMTPGPSIAASNIEEMARRAKESLARNSQYEEVSLKAFWSDISFMSECVPAGESAAAAFTIYFEILPNGDLGEVVLDPETMTAECIRRHVMHRKFPTPPGGAYVTRINMKFKP